LVVWLIYVAWIFLVDKNAASSGNRVVPWVRKLFYWKYFRAYFPAELVKTADLDPSKTYIFGAHPHGIIGMSVWANFFNDYSGFQELFPGVSLRIGTLATNFKLPFTREYYLALGLVDVNRSTILSLLSKHHSVMIIVGGAAESLYARPGSAELVLQSRKGFVKIALQTGSSLVPVYSFGENDLYDQLPNPEGSVVRKIQEWQKNTLGWTTPFFNGRGVWNYNFGLLPHRRPITTVVGAPIDVPKIEKPTDEEVDEYHQKYLDSLKVLFDEWKEKLNQPEAELKFVQ